MQVLMRNVHDALRRELLYEIRSSGDYSYPEAEGGCVEGVFETEPNLEELADFCEYVVEEGKTVYDGSWGAYELFSFLKDQLQEYHIGDMYRIRLSFGSILPPLALLPFLSVCSEISEIDIEFLHDKWESRGDYTSKHRLGIAFVNGEIVVGDSKRIRRQAEKFAYDYPNGETGKQGFLVPFGAKEIKRSAFLKNLGLRDEIIPDGVEKIGAYAFSGCERLQSIVIPDSVREIGYFAFHNCRSLQEIVIPSGVTSISAKAFEGCSALKNVVISDGVKEVGASAFDGCVSLREVLLPDSVLEVGESAFRDCKRLRNMTLSKGMTTIRKGTFSHCEALESISIPSNIQTIQSWAFSSCSALRAALLSEGLTEIGQEAFFRCASLEKLVVPSTVSEISYRAFSGCSSLKSIVIPKNVAAIKSVFCFCNALEGIFVDPDNEHYTDVDGVLFSKDRKTLVTYPANKAGEEYQISQGVKEIGTYAFSGCNSLKSVVIPEGVKEIGTYAFSSCNSLKSVVIPEGVKEIETYAFSGCNSLKSIVIPQSVKEIGDYAFSDCNSLESVVIPKGVKRIESYAFRGCNSLKNIVIPKGVKKIGFQAFFGCNSLESVVISEGVKEIGYRPFFGCNSLKSIVIPNGVKVIGSDAFSDCFSLESIVVSKCETTVGFTATEERGASAKKKESELQAEWMDIDGVLFSKDGKRLIAYPPNRPGTEYTVPLGTEEIADYAFKNCRPLKHVVISEGVKKIGTRAFSGAISLSSVVFPTTLETVEERAFDKLVSDFYYYGDGTTTIPCTFYLVPGASRAVWNLLKSYRHPMRYAQNTTVPARADTPLPVAKKWSEVRDAVSVEYEGKIFVLTGFDLNEENTLVGYITQKGGAVKSSVVLATDYLVVNLSYEGAETTKYKRALELNGKGKTIRIISGDKIFSEMKEGKS